MGMFARARVLSVALIFCGSVVGCALAATPAHADADNVDNHLCLDTGFGYYGVSDHVHITDTSGTYHISTFGQASGWTYFGTGLYCYENSTNLGCTTTVWEDVYENGLYLSSTAIFSGSGVHTVGTGTRSFGTTYGNYLVESFVRARFGSGCTSEADGLLAATDIN